jgi:ComF family protein
LLYEYLQASLQPGEWPDLIIPVPLHPLRLQQRGYNQTLVLARGLSRSSGISLEARRCKRRRDTPSQQRLDAATRQRNLKDAFDYSGTLTGQHVAILDDVITTGATTESLCNTLLQKGARHVQVWAIARTPLE